MLRLRAGFPAANPYMPGLVNPAMNPFLAMGRGPFDPLMAWYMAHYGTTGLVPGIGFTGRQVQLGNNSCSAYVHTIPSLLQTPCP